MSLETLSTELKQLILGFLDLVSLINIRNTNRALRDIVNDTLTQSGVIRPARAKLLQLYLQLHLYPSFRASRRLIGPHIKRFSRSQYLEQLQSQISAHSPKARIPEEFALWVTEWPENAVIGWAWPALDPDFDSATGKRGETTRLRHYRPRQRTLEREQRNRLSLAYPDEESNCAIGTVGQIPSVQLPNEEQVHWWRTYGSNMLCLTGDEGAGAYNRLCWSMEGDQLLGLFVQFHGCTYYTVLFFNYGSARDGMVFIDDICDMEFADPGQGSTCLIGSWVEFLRAELTKIENQYS
jgi:hypothetical protein